MGRGKRWRRRLLRVLIVVVLLAGLLVAFAPTLAGTGVVRRYVAERIGEALGRGVEVEELEAGWTSGVRLKNLQVKNRGEVFAGDAMVEVASVHVENDLTDLIFGSDGPVRVVIEGAVVRVEEQAGGRTNLDDLIARFTAPPAVPAVPPKKPPPLRLELRDCNVELRRLPRRPQPRAFDPFTEDPVILPADEGAMVIALERFDLSVATGGEKTQLRFDGGVTLDGKGGHVKGELDLGAEVAGSVEATGVDLAVVAPFVGADLAGRVDLRASRAPDAAVEVKARVHDFAIAGEGLPSVTEEWIELAARATDQDGTIVLDNLTLRSASQEIAIDGSGSAETLRLNASVPGRYLLAPLGRKPRQGRASFDLTAVRGEEEYAVKGVLELMDFVFEDAVLARAGPTNLQADFDLGVATDLRRVKIRNLVARTEDRLDVTLRGNATLGGSLACDVAGRGTADLGYVSMFLPLPKDARIAGRAQVSQFALKLAEEIVVKADAEVTDFVASGVVAQEVVSKKSVLSLDATLTEDAVHVRSGQLNDLTFHGTVVGLRDGVVRDAEGEVKGTLQLTPLLARLAGIEAELDGRVDIALTATRDEKSVVVAGKTTVHDLRFSGPQGTFEAKTVRLDLNGARAEEVWKGTVGIDVPEELDAEVGFILGKDETSANLTLARAVLDRLLARVELPATLEARGTASGALRAERKDGLWSLSGNLRVPELTARFEGQGIEKANVTLQADVRQEEAAWRVDLPDLRVDDLRFQVRDGRIEKNGRVVGTLEGAGKLKDFLRYLPQSEEVQVSGPAVVSATVALQDGALDVAGKVEVARLATRIGKQRLPTKKVVLEAKASGKGEQWTVETAKLAVGRALLKARGTFGKQTELFVEGTGDLTLLMSLVPDIAGEGDLTLTEARLERGEAGAWEVTTAGTIDAKRLDIQGTVLHKARGEFTVTGTLAGADWRDLETAVFLKAARVDAGVVRLVDAEINETGGGEILASGKGKGYAFRAQFGAKQAHVEDAAPFEGVRVGVRGKVHDLNLDRVTAAGVTGDVTFDKFKSGSVEWRNGVADLELRGEILNVTRLEALVNQGKVEGEGTVDFRKKPLRWKGNVRAKDVQLDEALGDPLSFMVPILKLSGRRAERSLKGTLGADIRLSGTGTGGPELQQSLAGGGNITFKSVAVRGSLLLPLLSLRLDKLLSGKPYEFEDLDVVFTVRDGHVKTKPFAIQGRPFGIEIDGDVRLDGRIDTIVRITAAGASGIPIAFPVPLRVRGTLDKPKVRPAPFGRR